VVQRPKPQTEGTAAASGGCLCGAVRFEIRGPLRQVTTCHCAMCRRSTTSVGAYTACAPEHLETSGRKLKWFKSSPMARRGFCSVCGSQLFWAPSDGRRVSVSAGSLDDPSRLTWGEHIFVNGVRG